MIPSHLHVLLFMNADSNLYFVPDNTARHLLPLFIPRSFIIMQVRFANHPSLQLRDNWLNRKGCGPINVFECKAPLAANFMTHLIKERSYSGRVKKEMNENETDLCRSFVWSGVEIRINIRN